MLDEAFLKIHKFCGIRFEYEAFKVMVISGQEKINKLTRFLETVPFKRNCASPLRILNILFT
jgi:hypothetical protein